MSSTANSSPIVYIDGENFMHLASKVLITEGLINDRSDITKLDFKYIAKQIVPAEDPSVRYYGAKVRVIRSDTSLEQKTIQISNNQGQLKHALRKQGVQFIDTGRLKVRDSNACKQCGHRYQHLQEKGVDVSIAVGMVVESENNRDLYLVSSDTDLLPAINKARERGSKVIYVGFSRHLTKAIIYNTDKCITIRDTEIIEAFKNLNPPKLL